MDKKVQLNVNIDIELLKKLKILAVEKNMKLGDLVNKLLSEKINTYKFKINKRSVSKKDALNCTNFMRSLFEAKYKNRNIVIKSLHLNNYYLLQKSLHNGISPIPID